MSQIRGNEELIWKVGPYSTYTQPFDKNFSGFWFQTTDLKSVVLVISRGDNLQVGMTDYVKNLKDMATSKKKGFYPFIGIIQQFSSSLYSYFYFDAYKCDIRKAILLILLEQKDSNKQFKEIISLIKQVTLSYNAAFQKDSLFPAHNCLNYKNILLSQYPSPEGQGIVFRDMWQSLPLLQIYQQLANTHNQTAFATTNITVENEYPIDIAPEFEESIKRQEPKGSQASDIYTFGKFLSWIYQDIKKTIKPSSEQDSFFILTINQMTQQYPEQRLSWEKLYSKLSSFLTPTTNQMYTQPVSSNSSISQNRTEKQVSVQQTSNNHTPKSNSISYLGYQDIQNARQLRGNELETVNRIIQQQNGLSDYTWIRKQVQLPSAQEQFTSLSQRSEEIRRSLQVNGREDLFDVFKKIEKTMQYRNLSFALIEMFFYISCEGAFAKYNLDKEDVFGLMISCLAFAKYQIDKGVQMLSQKDRDQEVSCQAVCDFLSKEQSQISGIHDLYMSSLKADLFLLQQLSVPNQKLELETNLNKLMVSLQAKISSLQVVNAQQRDEYLDGISFRLVRLQTLEQYLWDEESNRMFDFPSYFKQLSRVK